jgi:hypothetical protein
MTFRYYITDPVISKKSVNDEIIIEFKLYARMFSEAILSFCISIYIFIFLLFIPSNKLDKQQPLLSRPRTVRSYFMT